MKIEPKKFMLSISMALTVPLALLFIIFFNLGNLILSFIFLILSIIGFYLFHFSNQRKWKFSNKKLCLSGLSYILTIDGLITIVLLALFLFIMQLLPTPKLF